MGKTNLSIFLLNLFAFTFIVGLFTYFYEEFLGSDVYNDITLILLFYYVFLTGFVFYIITLVNKDGAKSFITYFIMSIVIKLIFTIVLAAVVIYLYPETVVVNVVLIMIYYILFTGLELFFVKKLIDEQDTQSSEV